MTLVMYCFIATVSVAFTLPWVRVCVCVSVSSLGQVYEWVMHIVQQCESDVGNPRARCYRSFQREEANCRCSLTLYTCSPVWGRGTPLPPCPFTSSSFPLFTFPFLSLALLIFFFCPSPSLPFLPE